MIFLENDKQQLMLICHNYIFHINRRYENKVFWKCMGYKTWNCKCRVTSIGTVLKLPLVEHNHESHVNEIRMRLKSMKYRLITIPNCHNLT